MEQIKNEFLPIRFFMWFVDSPSIVILKNMVLDVVLGSQL